MIKAEGIEKSFNNLKVLKGVDFQADGAEVVAIVGASGAGKTTLLQVLGSLSIPDKGKVFIDETDIFSLSSKKMAEFRNKKIGFVFQSHHLLPEFTALENVMIPALIAKKSAHDASKEAEQILSDLGLGGRLTHKPSELSGGEQQRVAIGRAIINHHSIVFADEPTGNLDSNTKKEIHKLFFDLRDKYSQTIIIVTHDMNLANMCDRKVEIIDGVI